MPKTGFEEADIDQLHKILKKFKPNTEIAIAKISGDEVFFTGAKVASDGTVSETDNHASVFEIGSISKVFTATLLANMVVEGEIDPDSCISQHLGYHLHRNVTITPKELANHTSGLSRLPPSMFWNAIFGSAENPYAEYGPKELKHDLQDRIKLKKKGKSRYSNLGAGALGHVLSLVANQPYGDLLKERIFKPLGMHRSAASSQEVSEHLISGLNKKGEPTSNWDFDALAGAGAILSTVEDLAKFAQANFNTSDPVYELTQTPTAKMNFMEKIGLGWMIQQPRDKELPAQHWHNGGTGGYSSCMVMDTENKTGVIVLSNVSGLFLFKSQEITNLAFNLHDRMLATEN